jgi:hypothetical protein
MLHEKTGSTFRNGVSAGRRLAFQYNHAMPALLQVIGGGQTRDTATNDNNVGSHGFGAPD